LLSLERQPHEVKGDSDLQRTRRRDNSRNSWIISARRRRSRIEEISYGIWVTVEKLSGARDQRQAYFAVRNSYSHGTRSFKRAAPVRSTAARAYAERVDLRRLTFFAPGTSSRTGAVFAVSDALSAVARAGSAASDGCKGESEKRPVGRLSWKRF
jgi:hypothetical protein